MKKMMIMVSAMMMVATALATDNKNVKPFQGVSVGVPARVRFVYGEEYKVDVQSADTLAASAIRFSVQDGVLKIRSIDENEEVDNVCITIVSPVEPTLTVGRNMEVKPTKRVQKALAVK